MVLSKMRTIMHHPYGDMTEFRVADQKGRIALGSRFSGKRFALIEEADETVRLVPILVIPEQDHPLTSRRLAATFDELALLTDNWDGRGSPAPSVEILASAREVLGVLHAVAMARGIRWTCPHVGSNERGEIILEWWQGPRSLTVFVRAECRIDYLKSWGSDINSEMEDGELARMSDFGTLWAWLCADRLEAA